MRNFKYLFMGVLLLILAFSAIAPVNATQYVKTSDLTADTAPVASDTIVFDDVSAGTTDKSTIANIFASAANIGASTIVTVGALDSGSITSNFGNIDNGTSNITSGGIWSVDVDGGSGDAAIGAAGAITWGGGSDASVWFDGTDMFISSTTDVNFDAAGDDFIFSSSDTIVATIDDTGIDIVTNDFTTGGKYDIDVDGTAIDSAGSYTFGASADAGLYFDGTDMIISSTVDIVYAATGADHIFKSNAARTTVLTVDDTGIDVEALNITSGGIWRIDVDGTALAAVGALGFGAGTDDSGLFWDGADHVVTSTGGITEGVVEASDINFYEGITETMRIDFSDNASDTALVLWNRADNSLIRVTTGVNDSGGTGFRALVIPNI